MFLRRSFFECLKQWTNVNMTKRSQSTETTGISNEEMFGSVGLEIVTSIS